MNRVPWTSPLALMLAFAVMACGETYDEGGELGDETEVSEPMETMDESYAYQDWDADMNRMLNRSEFGTWADEQGWGEMDEERFSETAYELWDLDDDDAVTEEEWRESTDRWFDDEVTIGTWSDWDGDGDSDQRGYGDLG